MTRAFLTGCLLCLGCAGTETGNPSIAAQIALTAHSSDPGRVAIRAAEGGLTLQRAWLSLGALSLVEGPDCSAEARRFTAPALGAADHAEPRPALLALEAEAGEYCGLAVPFAPTTEMPPGAPAELGELSILLEGTLLDGSAFSLGSAARREVLVQSTPPGFALDGVRSALLVGFDVATWLRSPNIADAERELDGSVRIDAAHNPALLQSFEAALAPGIELYRDRDADAVLDPQPELLGRGSD